VTPSESTLAMLDAFTSTGATRFDVTLLLLAGKQAGYRGAVPANALRRTLPSMIESADRRSESVIVRPHSERTAFVQLDDLDREAARHLKDVAFLVLRTSRGSYQAWLALPSQGRDADLDLRRRLRKGSCADVSASGATRCAGSRNFKPKYAPTFPLVTIVHVAPGRFTSREALEALGLIGKPEPIEKPAARQAYCSTTGGAWPSMEIALRGAVRKPNGQADRSDADFRYALTCISWGRAPQEIAARLSTESARASEWCAERGAAAWEREIERTVSNAARIATRRAA
jgi:hypothetical protein